LAFLKGHMEQEGATALDLAVRYGFGAIVYKLCSGHSPEKGFY